MSVFEVFIPLWHPATFNEMKRTGHWAGAQRLKNRDFAMVNAYRLRYGLPKATGKRRIYLHIVRKPRQQAADIDAHSKSFLDALKRSGLILDDNPKHAELQPVTYSDKTTANWGTRITLEDM